MPGPLARKIKEKYPQYRNIPDDELERQVLAKYPQYRALAQEEPTTPNTFGSRLSESATNTVKGIGSMLSTVSRLASPTGMLMDSIRNRDRIQETAKQTKDIALGSVAPITGAYSGFQEDGLSGGIKGAGSGLLETFGADPAAVKEDWRTGNYGALAGDLALPAAITVATAGAGRFARGRRASVPKPVLGDLPMPTTSPDLPPPRLLGGLTPEGYLHNDGTLQPLAPSPPFIEADIIPGSERGVGSRLLTAGNRPPQLALPAKGETSNPSNFRAHPTGKVADIRNLDTPEALQGLDLETPGTADIVDARRATDDMYRPGSRVTIEPPVFEPWDFDTPTSKQKGSLPDPQPFDVPHVGGVHNVSTKRGIKGEVTSRDFLESNPVMATVPNRLRPEPPNVSWMKDDVKRITPDTEVLPAETTTVQIGKGIPGRKSKGLPDLEYPDPNVPAVKRAYEEGGRVVDPPKPIRPYDPNKVDVINRKLSPEPVDIPSGPKGTVGYDKLFDRDTRKTTKAGRVRAIKDSFPKGKARKVATTVVNDIQKVVPTVAPATITGIIKERINNSAWKHVYDKVFTSPTRQLDNMGEGGKKISIAIRDANTAARSLGGKYDMEFSNAFKGLNEAQQNQVIKLLDGQIKLDQNTPPNVTAAYQRARKALDELGIEAEKAGVSGEFGKFKRMEGEYFPHEFEPGKFPKEEVRRILAEEGKSITEINAILDSPRKFKEFTLSYQKGRFKNLPGYMEKPEVLTRYAYEMAKKIEYTKRFGARDIADPDSPISQLVRGSENIEKSSKILSDYFGRSQKFDIEDSKVAQAITKFEVATKLSLSAINQIADVALLPVKTSFTDFIKGAAKVIKDAEGSRDLAMRGGNLEILRNEALRELGAGTKWGKIYGLTAVESKLRTIQAVVGRSYAQTLFDQVKANPKNKTLRHRFGEFVEGKDIDSILQQDRLTDAQLDFASGRMSELSAGVPDKASLPHAYTSISPIARLPLLFQRFAFLTTKNLKDTIFSEPTYQGKIAKTAAALGAYQIAGEVAGDLKEIAKGLVDTVIGGKGIGKRLESRGKEQFYSTGNDIVDRMIANSLQSWFFGFLGGKIESAYRGSSGYQRGQGFVKDLAGPVGGTVGDIVSLATDPSMSNVKSQVIKRIPFVGGAINEKMRERKVSPNSPFK